jgi:S1-C subfamily serine protease
MGGGGGSGLGKRSIIHHCLSRSRSLPINPPPLMLSQGSSSNLFVGQKVYAIGNPFGLDHTLTSGLISGERVLPMS